MPSGSPPEEPFDVDAPAESTAPWCHARDPCLDHEALSLGPGSRQDPDGADIEFQGTPETGRCAPEPAAQRALDIDEDTRIQPRHSGPQPSGEGLTGDGIDKDATSSPRIAVDDHREGADDVAAGEFALQRSSPHTTDEMDVAEGRRPYLILL